MDSNISGVKLSELSNVIGNLLCLIFFTSFS
jgi:hypothetical protein